MENKIKQVQEEVKDVKKEVDYFEMTLKILEKSNQFKEKAIKILGGLLCLALIVNGFLCYYIATTTVMETIEYTQDGDYNAINEDGSLTNGGYYGTTNEEANKTKSENQNGN